MAEGIIVNATLKLSTIVCYQCAVTFAVPISLHETLKDTGRDFYCPNGHCQVYSRPKLNVLKEQLEGERKKNKRLNDRLDTAIDLRDKYLRKFRAQKGQKTKILNRIKKGVCPCCNRQFENLHNHMKTKHPELFEEKK